MMTKIKIVAISLLGLITAIGVVVAGVIFGIFLSILSMIASVFTVLGLIWFGSKDFDDTD